MGQDHGIRGTLAAELSARLEDPAPASAAGPGWAIDGTVRLRGVHGWRLPARAGDPGANLTFQARWQPGQQHLTVTQCVLEAPHSRLSATLDLDWARGFRPTIVLASSTLSLADLLAWPRAFGAGIADDLAVEGALDMRAQLAGWPLQINEFELASKGAVIRSASLPGPVRVGRLASRWSANSLRFLPAALELPPAAPGQAGARLAASSGSLRIEGLVGPFRENAHPLDAPYRLSLSGTAARAQDLLALAVAGGWSSDEDWTIEGPVSLHFNWAGSLRPGTSILTGTAEASDLQVATSRLTQPVLVSSARLDVRRGRPHVKFSGARALGAHWAGSIRAADGARWDFDLAADRLDGAEIEQWLGPAARPNLLRRILPFADSDSAAQIPARLAAAFAGLRAQGRIRVASLLLPPFQLEDLDAGAHIAGPVLSLRNARAVIYGGQASGDLEARLAAEPSYSLRTEFTRVDLGQVAAAASLSGNFAGLASGELSADARGLAFEDLLASVEGRGLLRIRETPTGELQRLIGLAEIASGSPAPLRPSSRGQIIADFEIAGGALHFNPVRFARPGEHIEATGTIDFEGRLDLRAHAVVPQTPRTAAPAAQPGTWSIAGTLGAPRVTHLSLLTEGAAPPPPAPAVAAPVVAVPPVAKP
jgi:hypothetical protein